MKFSKIRISKMPIHCINCFSAIIINSQYYLTGHMGPEIISVVEQNLGYEVSDGVICDQCFTTILQEIGTRNNEHKQPLSYEGNKCIWCCSSLFRKRSHDLPQGPERHLISERIFPREIPDGSLVCFSCWIQAKRILHQQGIISIAPSNANICVQCQVSLSHRRRHSIPEGPERDEIARSIYPREIPSNGLVCYACWVAARRNVQRARTRNLVNVEELLESGPWHSHFRDQCIWCHTSLFRRQTRVLSGAERDEVAARIYPTELPQHALVCSNCWHRARLNIEIAEGQKIAYLATDNVGTMTLDNFTHTTSSSRNCFVPGCTNVERCRVPDLLRKNILKSHKVFVTENARICVKHKSLYDWEFLDQYQFSNTFTKKEMESMLKLITNGQRELATNHG